MSQWLADTSDPKRILPPDYHTHTFLCKHADGSPIDYAFHAARKGLPGIAVTDHCPMPQGYDPEHRMDYDKFGRYRDLVQEAKELSPVRVALGVEVDFVPQCADEVKDWTKSQGLEVVLGSVHFLDYWAVDDPAQRFLWESADIAGVWRRYFELVKCMVETGLCHIVAHLDLPKKFGQRPSLAVQREVILPVLDAIAQRGMAIEINTSGLFHPVGELYPSAQILSWAAERGIGVTFGSDAHQPDRVGSAFAHAVAFADECGARWHPLIAESRPASTADQG